MPSTAEFPARLKATFGPSIIRVCAQPGPGVVRGIGTGLLFRLAGVSFLVTADHVFGDAGTQQLLCFREGNNKLASKGGEVLFTREPVLDVAVLKLDEISVKRLSDSDFRTQLDITTGPPQASDTFCIYGYPIDPDYSSTRLTAWKSIPLICLVRLATVSSPLSNHSSTSNLLFEIDLNEVTDASGREGRLPDSLGGISGGPIFRFSNTGDVSIVAVETSTFRSANKLQIKATPWSFVLGLVDQHLGGIAPATKLALPPQSLI